MALMEEFVNSIISNSSKESKRNVTTFFVKLEEILNSRDTKQAVLNLNFHSIPGNLERIKKFKEIFNKRLESAVGEILLDSKSGDSPVGLGLLRKSEKISELLREKGNGFFKRGRLELALRCFTLAGMYAPKGTKTEALAYSNRSAAFAKKHNWKMCLKDIQRFEKIVEKNLIKTGGGTNQLIEKQKRQCLKPDAHNEEGPGEELIFAKDFFKLSKPSKTIPSAEEFVGIKVDPKKGRGLYNIGKNSIEPGTLLILEEPYAHVQRETFSHHIKNCSACYKDLNGGGVPCDGCVFNIYCSETCAASAFHNNHFHFECKIAPFLYEMNMARASHLALTILLKLSPEGFKEYLETEKTADTPANSKIAGFNESGIFESNSYLPIANQMYHEEIVSKNDFFLHCKDAVLLTKIVDFGTDYFSSLNLDPAEASPAKEMFEKALLYHIMSIGVNGNTLERMSLPPGRSPTADEITQAGGEKIGSAMFPLVSLLNHSCYANVTSETLPGGKFGVIALQFIAPGQEFLTSYGPHYGKSGRAERRMNLQKQHGFICECDACNNDWSRESFVGLGQDLNKTCPECKIYFGEKIVLEVKPGEDGQTLECGKCQWKISMNELLEKNEYFNYLGLEAFKTVTQNKPVKGFVDATKCVKYHNSFGLGPMSFDQETMKQALWLIARRMFE